MSRWPDEWAARDLSGLQWLHRAAGMPVIDWGLTVVSKAADGALWLALIAVLPWIGGPQGSFCAMRMTAVGAINLVIYKILKRCVRRHRPYVACSDIRCCTRALDEHSFPSGHTLHAVAFAVVLCAYYPAHELLCWTFAALVAVSRMVLGLHYPSDVFAGAVIGFLTAAVMVQNW